MKKLFKILSFLLILFTFQLGYSQLSKTHYIPPLSSTFANNAGSDNAPNEQWFHISTPSENAVNFTIKRGDGSDFATGTVSNAVPWTDRANLGDNQNDQFGYLFAQPNSQEQILTQHGFIIEADEEIYVSARFIARSNNHGGALVSKGESALGNRFRTGSLQVGGDHMSFFSLMATDDNTFVTINLPAGVASLAGTTGTINVGPLNRGQSYIIGNNETRNGIIGSLIESTKPIVVNTGSGVGSFSPGVPGAGGQDFGVDQIVGVDLVGSEYIFVKGNGRDSWENVLIIADQNNTKININGSPYSDGAGNQITLNEGEFIVIEGDQYVNGNMYVSTDNKDDKLFAYQGLGDVYGVAQYPAANQGMVFVPPLSCGTSGNVNNIANIDKVGDETFNDNAQVSLVTTKGSVVSVNGAQIFAADGNVNRNDVLGNDNYETYDILP